MTLILLLHRHHAVHVAMAKHGSAQECVQCQHSIEIHMPMHNIIEY